MPRSRFRQFLRRLGWWRASLALLLGCAGLTGALVFLLPVLNSEAEQPGAVECAGAGSCAVATPCDPAVCPPAGRPACTSAACAPAATPPCGYGGCATAARPAGATPAFLISAPPPAITARAAAVIEAPCGALLHGQHEHERLPPASLTKIAGALVALEHAASQDVVEVRVDGASLASATRSSVIGLRPGMRVTVGDLLHGMLLVSGNDAAVAVAEHVAGSVPAFVELMNQRAAQLGVRDTHFTNPHGLDDPGLFSSAFDMATLGGELLEQPELAAIVATRAHQPAWGGPPLENRNSLLADYPGAIGVKTGTTPQAGQTIVAAADRGGRRLIVSVMRSADRYADARALLDWAFSSTTPPCEG